jgi:hypothetical protein
MSDYDGWVPADNPADNPLARERDVVESKPDPDAVPAAASPTWRRWAFPVGLLSTGALIGAILAATLSANASSSPSPSPGAAAGVPGYAAPYGPPDHRGGMAPGRPGGFRLDHTGTVTAVGTNSVTIKESTATTTYAVSSTSDIDKNGEAKLSDLKAGDKVIFSVVTVSGKKTIGILHSGNEALNRPQHGPGDRDGDHHWGH